MDTQGTLSRKVALVTVSTEGIGFVAARRLAQDGAHVVLSSRKQSNVDRAVAQLRAENLSVCGTVCHVDRAEIWERLVVMALEHHGSIDILVSNAAANPFFGNTLDASEDVWSKINMTVTTLLVGLVVPHMEKRGRWARTASLRRPCWASPRPWPPSWTPATSASTAWRRESYGPNSAASSLWKDEAMKEKMMENLRVQRLGVLSDCAGIIVFLCSPDASYITGKMLVVAGGAPSRL